MPEKLIALHREIRRCAKCRDIIDPGWNVPRSGFPPSRSYKAMMIGAEPGRRRVPDRPTPEQYRERFIPHDPSKPGPEQAKRNTIRWLFEDLKKANLPWDSLFYTNAVKCPAKPRQSKRCIEHCRPFVERQIEVLKPRFIVVIGRAARFLGLRRDARDMPQRTRWRGIPVLVIRHPQGASKGYRAKVVGKVKRLLRSTT